MAELDSKQALAAAAANPVLQCVPSEALVGELLRRRALHLADREICEPAERLADMARELARLALAADVLERDPDWEL